MTKLDPEQCHMDHRLEHHVDLPEDEEYVEEANYSAGDAAYIASQDGSILPAVAEMGFLLQNGSGSGSRSRHASRRDDDCLELPKHQMEIDLSDYQKDLSVSLTNSESESSSRRSSAIDAKIKKYELGFKEPSEKSSDTSSSGRGVTWRNAIGITLLLFANLLNYMDRYTIAGVLLQVKEYYNIENGAAGLLQTSFIVSYMLFSPIFGFLGDRYNRKLIMAIGIFFWSGITLASSFVPANYFHVFLFMRGLVGIGEASYSTIAPTIIADLFVGDQRTRALSFFYFAIPVGSGLGYIVGSNVALAMGEWQWALRVTPFLGVLCVILIVLVVKEPTRGASEGSHHVVTAASWSSYKADLRYLVGNKSFMLSSLGFTCVAFVAGALALWAPAYVEYSIRVQGHQEEEATVSLIFGVITCAAGFLGVALGSESARRIRRVNPRADPLVCAFGLISCSPFLFLTIYMARYNTTAIWVLIFLGETLLCLNWAIVTDILLYIVVPQRRSTAEAFQILLSHALGDAGSPYMIGAISDSVARNSRIPGAVGMTFVGLHYALYTSCFVAVLGGGFFLATAVYLQGDKAKAQKAMRGSNSLEGTTSGESSTSSSSSRLSAETNQTFADGPITAQQPAITT